jgi:hypothetical protein
MTPEQKAAAFDALMAILESAPQTGEITIRKYANNWRVSMVAVGVRDTSAHDAPYWLRASAIDGAEDLRNVLIGMHNELKAAEVK